MSIDLISFAILALATWRLSSLLVDEDGISNIFERIRTWFGVRYMASKETSAVERIVPDDTPPLKKVIAKWLTCRWCCSIWIGLALAGLYVLWTGTAIIVLPWAISAGAIIIDAIIGRRYRRRVYLD